MHSENVTLPDLFKCHRLRYIEHYFEPFIDLLALRWSFGIVMISALICGVSMLSLKSQYLEPILMRFGLDQSGVSLHIFNTIILESRLSINLLLLPKGDAFDPSDERC
jgi:hypothetical protein